MYTTFQSYSTTRLVRRHDNNIDSNFLTNDDTDAKESMILSTQFKDGAWTDVQYFTHVTQDSDHGD